MSLYSLAGTPTQGSEKPGKFVLVTSRQHPLWDAMENWFRKCFAALPEARRWQDSAWMRRRRGGRKWEVWRSAHSVAPMRERNPNKVQKDNAKIFHRSRVTLESEMFTLEAMRLLRCCCLRQRHGEASGLARPPQPFFCSKPFDTTSTSSPRPGSMVAGCSCRVSHCFIWWTFKQIHTHQMMAMSSSGAALLHAERWSYFLQITFFFAFGHHCRFHPDSWNYSYITIKWNK